MVEYYFEAYDNSGNRTTLPDNADAFADEQHNQFGNVSNVFEFTCLPTMVSDILYVDDYHGIGSFYGEVEEYFNQTFLAVMTPDNQPDRYDVNGPNLRVSNGLGSRAHWKQLAEAYVKIIWDSGDLDEATICDGTAASDKSNDQQLLQDWVAFSQDDRGLWICGDNIAYDMSVNMAIPPGGGLFGTCNVSYIGDSYFIFTGETSPIVTGVNTGIFWNIGEPDQCYAFGGCPTFNRFDFLETLVSPPVFGARSLRYPFASPILYAGIQSQYPKPVDGAMRTMWWGFSFMYVRDINPSAPLVRNRLFQEVMEWMQNYVNSNTTGDETPGVFSYHLDQNYPNPFNPSTRIIFGLKDAGRVSIRIYDTAGRLVRNLIDERRLPGDYEELWDGRDDKGLEVASGVYFCRMTAGESNVTKKMVLLR